MTGTQVHLFVAGLFGAAGTALWAFAVHTGQDTAAVAAQMLMIHAAALAGLTAARRTGALPDRAGMWAISGLAFGVILFAGDLTMRSISGVPLFPLAAPAGGLLTIGGWLVLAILGLFGGARR
jgi:uncharacterized membrane protein YgdD (TMEM256/DUF423 family)